MDVTALSLGSPPLREMPLRQSDNSNALSFARLRTRVLSERTDMEVGNQGVH